MVGNKQSRWDSRPLRFYRWSVVMMSAVAVVNHESGLPWEWLYGQGAPGSTAWRAREEEVALGVAAAPTRPGPARPACDLPFYPPSPFFVTGDTNKRV